jgi:hypothetical protein
MQFGLVRDTEEGLAKQYKIKAFPTLYVIKDGKPIKFDGKAFTYDKIFEFINVYSQVFIDPTNMDNNAEPKQSAAAKPWLITSVPQLTSNSGNDICLKKDGVLCIIMVNKDAASMQK